MLALPEHLHPMTVHFPIALFMTALGLDVLSLIFKKESLHKTALHIYIVAAVLTPLVVRTGIWEVEKLQINHPVLDKHRQFAIGTMWASLMSLPVLYFVKEKCSKYFRLIFLVFLIGTVSLVALTAEEGGEMVYEYGVGVEK